MFLNRPIFAAPQTHLLAFFVYYIQNVLNRTPIKLYISARFLLSDSSVLNISSVQIASLLAFLFQGIRIAVLFARLLSNS